MPVGVGGEQRLLKPLSLKGLATDGDVSSGESGTRSSLTAESGLSGSGSEPLALTAARFLAALFRSERRDFSISSLSSGSSVSSRAPLRDSSRCRFLPEVGGEAGNGGL